MVSFGGLNKLAGADVPPCTTAANFSGYRNGEENVQRGGTTKHKIKMKKERKFAYDMFV